MRPEAGSGYLWRLLLFRLGTRLGRVFLAEQCVLLLLKPQFCVCGEFLPFFSGRDYVLVELIFLHR